MATPNEDERGAMGFDRIKNLKSEEFRRLTGVKPETFNKMVEIMDEALREKKSRGGRPNKLSLQKIHAKVALPKKRSKKHPLSKEDKQNNTTLAKERVLVENVIGILKRFKIISDRYR
ncbi:MAG: hypothetical protein HYZ47_02820, partial [Simkania negevensis]|nr:hypothetical protein [Simkania negevensis]